MSYQIKLWNLQILLQVVHYDFYTSLFIVEIKCKPCRILFSEILNISASIQGWVFFLNLFPIIHVVVAEAVLALVTN
jgi:hypothetical protein